MDTLELLYAHYAESYQLSKQTQDERNKLFIILTVIMAIHFLFILDPDSLLLTLSEWLKESHHISITVEFKTLQSLLWFILLYYTIRYYQVNTYIERQYAYIHHLETEISSKAAIPFDRESGNYLKDYPKLLDFVAIIYRVVYPVLYLFVVSVKIGYEIYLYTLSGALALDILLFVCCFALTVLYLTFLHKTYVLNKFNQLRARLRS
ncbi:MAG: hypothetical protein ACRDBO_10900 [Lachnospiraceae bacterium]